MSIEFLVLGLYAICMWLAKTKVSAKATLHVLKQPRYVWRALLYSAGILFILQWLFAFSQVTAVLDQDPLGLPRYLIDGYVNFLILIDGFIPISLLIIAILQGTALSMLKFVRDNESKHKGQRWRSMTLALFGSGCVACGGSIIAPLFSSFSAGASSYLSTTISQIVLTIAILLALRSLRDIGLKIASILSLENYNAA